MSEVLITRPIPEAGISALRAAGVAFEINPKDRPLSRQELLAGVRGRRGVLCLIHDRIDDEVFDAAGAGCVIFANMAVGYDNIDVEAASRRNIWITNTPDVLTDATADMAFALLMAAARRVVEGDRWMRSGTWPGWGPMQLLGHDVSGATLGIIGAGRIGSAVARRGSGFGMSILYSDTHPNDELDIVGARRVELDSLLAESDFVSLHVNLAAASHHLIGPHELSLMKSTAILVNTSRGPVLDEAALVEALRTGRIAAAGLDVYENEPALQTGLAELDNVVLAPHLGSATEQTRAKMARMAAENIIAALRGERPPNAVTAGTRR